MPRTTTGNTDFELIDSTGTVGLMLVKPGEPGAGEPITLDEMIAAASQDAPISQRLVPAIHVNTGRGVGIDYNSAEGVYSRTPGFYCPAGAATSVQIPLANNTTTPIVAIMDWGGDVWFAQRGAAATAGGRVFRSVGGTAAPSTTTFADYGGAAYITAGEYMRDLVVGDDGSGNSTLYAISSDVNYLNGRFHMWDGAQWQSTAAGEYGTNGRNRTRYVKWLTPDGAIGNRYVSINGRATVAYNDPDSDPMIGANWTNQVVTGTGYQLFEVAGARQRVWFSAIDGLFDLDGSGNSPNLTSYLADEMQSGTGDATFYHNNYVYISTGRGLDRIYVGAEGQLQELPGQCAPGWGTSAENRYRGYVTAMCSDQGYLVAALYEPTQKVASIWWGLDQQSEGSRNPLTWFGPEFHTGADYKITRIKTTGAGGDLRLWIAMQSVAAGNPVLMWQSLPVAGSPLQDLLAAGQMKFTTGSVGGFFQPFSRLSLMPEMMGDEISKKTLDRNGVGSRGLSVNEVTGANDGFGTKLTIYSRADPEPGSSTWGTGVDVTTYPSQVVTPAAATSGHRLETRVDFISPQGGASTPKIAVLTALRREAWRSAPTFRVIRPEVEYGSGVPTLGVDDQRDPDTVTNRLLAMTQAGRITMRDPHNQRYTVKVEQVLDRRTEWNDKEPFGKTVRCQLEINIIEGPL